MVIKSVYNIYKVEFSSLASFLVLFIDQQVDWSELTLEAALSIYNAHMMPKIRYMQLFFGGNSVEVEGVQILQKKCL